MKSAKIKSFKKPTARSINKCGLLFKHNLKSESSLQLRKGQSLCHKTLPCLIVFLKISIMLH